MIDSYKVKEQLSGLPELQEFSIYNEYMNEGMMFPCITIIFITIAEKGESVQIKLWSLDDDGAKERLVKGYETIKSLLDTREKNNNLSSKLFLGKSEVEAVELELENESDSIVQELISPLDTMILEEDVQGIKILSLPLILSSRMFESEMVKQEPDRS